MIHDVGLDRTHKLEVSCCTAARVSRMNLTPSDRNDDKSKQA
jgi:hypothetical protein